MKALGFVPANYNSSKVDPHLDHRDDSMLNPDEHVDLFVLTPQLYFSKTGNQIVHVELVVSNVEKTKGVFHKTRLDEALGKCINALNSYVCEVDRGKPLVVCQNIDYNTFFSSKCGGLEKSRSFERSRVRPEVHNWDNGGSSLFTIDHSHLQNTL